MSFYAGAVIALGPPDQSPTQVKVNPEGKEDIA
jgi:hypothetical protein